MLDKVISVVCIVAFLLAIFSKFLWPIIARVWINIEEKNGIKCEQCKTKMEDVSSYLYLIPVHIDDKHEESAEYYIKNAIPIQSKEQIPTGNRACYMYVFQCPQCGHRKVSIVDFLNVRGQELVKGGDIYPYEKFEQFFYRQI